MNERAILFDHDYYMDGIRTGKSNYENYKWIPDMTIPCIVRMMSHLGAKPNQSVLDWGCGPGAYVKALRLIGYNAIGYDISQWAVTHPIEGVDGFISNKQPCSRFDWILSKDVFEHIPEADLTGVIRTMLSLAQLGILLVVPLALSAVNRTYVNPADNNDSTHLICWTLPEWLSFVQHVVDKFSAPFTVSGGFKLPGVKQAADPYPQSCGFITVRRYE